MSRRNQQQNAAPASTTSLAEQLIQQDSASEAPREIAGTTEETEREPVQGEQLEGFAATDPVAAFGFADLPLGAQLTDADVERIADALFRRMALQPLEPKLEVVPVPVSPALMLADASTRRPLLVARKAVEEPIVVIGFVDLARGRVTPGLHCRSEFTAAELAELERTGCVEKE